MVSHMTVLLENHFLLNFCILCFEYLFPYIIIILFFIMRFVNLSKCLCSVNTYPVIFLYNALHVKGSQKICYGWTVNSYILELYLQFRVRELFSLFWQGSRFRMSNRKLQPFINEGEGVIFYCKTLGFWMTVNYHRQNYSHCTPWGLLASQKRKTEIVKFVCFLTTVYLETPNMPLLQTSRFQALLSKKVLNCGIQIGMTYNVIWSTVEATVWCRPREGISL